jgi:N-acetylneuraminate synthase
MVTRVQVIAEAGVNHNGDLALAERLVDIAAAAGADYVKFQAFRADRLASRGTPKAAYQRQHTDAAESQDAMLRRLELRPDDYRRLMDAAARRRIGFLCSPFDEESIELLAGLGVTALKIPSGELTNHDYLRRAASAASQLFLSTGMATLGEIERALDAMAGAGSPEIVLLHCVSSYPAPPAEANLRAIATLREAFGLPVGYSDHTEGTCIALAAVALGAVMLEKHFTTNRSLPGPDHAASLEPDELAALVGQVRQVEVALGDGRKRPMPSELETRGLVRKSLVLTRDLPAGHRLTAADLTVKRPGTGLAPERRGWVIGRALRTAKRADDVLTDDDV